MSARKFAGYWILVAALTAAAAILAYFQGAAIDPSPLNRVIAVVVIGVLLLVLRAPLASAWRFVAHYSPGRDARQHKRHPGARRGASDEDEGEEISLESHRRDNLRSALQERHGWRWRDRWVMVVGEASLIERLVPGLVDAGYVSTSDALLLYVGQTKGQLDTVWLDQIRALRRRRPIDAIAVVVRRRDQGRSAFDTDAISQSLMRYARALRWAAPAYLLNVTDFEEESSSADEAVGLTWSKARMEGSELDASLQTLEYNLSDTGVERLSQDPRDRYAAALGQHIAGLRAALSNLVQQVAQSRFWRYPVQGLLFAPLFTERELAASNAGNIFDAGPAPRAVWQNIAEHSREVHGHRVGFSLSTTLAWLVTAVVTIWILGAVVSGLTNRATIKTIQDTLAQVSNTQDPTQAMQALNALDQEIDTLELHQREGAPWTSRFGFNQDRALLDASWPAYASAANRILGEPIRQQLEESLRQLAATPNDKLAGADNAQAQSGYDLLKAYLMLTQPARVDAAFLTAQLKAAGAPARPANSALSIGAWEDVRQHTLAFFVNHLNRVPAHAPDASLVASARQTLIGVRSLQNSTDVLYQQILTDAKPKYPAVSLTELLGDTSSRGLFSTSQKTIPGVFTRQAWDERLSKAIDDLSEQRDVSGDWVLTDSRRDTQISSSLKADLRQRYFDDYTRAWAGFLNSVRWQPASTLSDMVDQLTLMGDPQRSPLVALMRVIVYQAGAGTAAQSLSDTLVNRAQQIVRGNEQDPAKQAQPTQAPLAMGFGPILRLTNSNLASGAANGGAGAGLTGTGDLSLARYLERVTAMRLKMQQIASSEDTDAMSRRAAQAVLQGKTSDISDSRDYASRLAASLGQQWAGFGDLFQAPLNQTWQVVVRPAAVSLNDIWRTAIVADWNQSLGGRYPFADSDDDVSLPEMARFMRPENGVIAQFITTQLAGVIERQGDHWAPVQGPNRGALTLAPGFLDALNTLMRVSTVLFPSGVGDARVRFDLRGIATPGINDVKLVLTERTFHYFNQREEWVPFEWPGHALDNRAHLEWTTQQAGLRSAYDEPGRFGLIRILEHAEVSRRDNARYVLTWTPDISLGVQLRVQMRSEAGAGPLEVLQLRHFTLPPAIFASSSDNVIAPGNPVSPARRAVKTPAPRAAPRRN